MVVLHYSHNSAKAKFLFVITILVLLLVSNNNVVGTSNSAIDNFLKCLPTKTSPTNPISKAIFTPTSPLFVGVLQTYIRESRLNTSTTPKPLAIITALDVTHVQATAICAKNNGLQIRIRSGGHDFEGMSYVSNVAFVILDMFNLRSVDVDVASETAWVQSGATVGELYYQIAKKSKVLAYPAGVCLTMGTGGHFSGGGYGNMLRQFGLTIDNIIDAQVVDAEGRLLNRKSMGEDLFWAIRGGGAASFCVVLSWRVKLVRVPDTVTVFNVPRTLNQGVTDIVMQWQQVAPKIDNKLFIRAQPQVIGQGAQKTVQVSFIGMYLGRADTLLALMSKIFPLLGLQKQDCSEMPWVESTLSWTGIAKGTPIEVLLQRKPSPPNNYHKGKSDYVKSPIGKAGLETIWKKMIELESVFMQWNAYGGRMSEISENATAFPHRLGNIFMVQYITLWYDGSDGSYSKNMKAAQEMYATMTPFVSRNPREAFLNYRDIDVGTNSNGNTGFASAFFKGNLKRLLQVKAKVDPTNFFRYEQSIPILPTNNEVIEKVEGSLSMPFIM